MEYLILLSTKRWFYSLQYPTRGVSKFYLYNFTIFSLILLHSGFDRFICNGCLSCLTNRSHQSLGRTVSLPTITTYWAFTKNSLDTVWVLFISILLCFRVVKISNLYETTPHIIKLLIDLSWKTDIFIKFLFLKYHTVLLVLGCPPRWLACFL